MQIIEQTNRTILFEKFNDSKYNILTLIGDVDNLESLEDEKVEEINKYLLVSSFDEFIEKFDPCIYSYMDVENRKIAYSLVKNPNIPDNLYTTIHINNENSFIKMLSTLMENRKNIDLKNIDFKYEDILELISPRKIINDIKQTRKEINYLYSKYVELSDDNPKKLDIGDSLNYKFSLASKNYNNVLSMLPLAIEDIKTRLSIGEDKNQISVDNIKLGYLEFSDKGELEFIENTFEKEKPKLLTNNSQELSLIFKEDYMTNTENPKEYIADLVSRTFVPITMSNVDINIENEVNNYNQYLELYKQSQEDFIKSARSLIEKIIGVKLFFEQYDITQKFMTPKLLITNIENEMLISPKSKEKLEKYLNTVNGKNEFTNTIWFAIYPNISLKEEYAKNNKRIFKNNNTINNSDTNSIENLSNIMDILSKYRIQVYVSFERGNDTSFDSLSISGIEKYVSKTKLVENKKYSEYIIPVIPNFTIIPKDKSGIKLDRKAIFINDKIEFSDNKLDEVEFFINGIYVDSSYIAAGICGAYQCPIFLKQKFRNVLSNNPGVRFNIEENDNGYIVKTTMAREISGFTNNIKERINSDNYGFIFASELGHINNDKITNITVYKARNLLKSQNGYYEPIYKTLTTTYIERIIRYITNDFKSDKLNYFFSNSPTSQKSIWLKEVNYINSIIKKGDDISHNIDIENNTCQLNFTFAGEIKNLKIEINKNI